MNILINTIWHIHLNTYIHFSCSWWECLHMEACNTSWKTKAVLVESASEKAQNTGVNPDIRRHLLRFKNNSSMFHHPSHFWKHTSPSGMDSTDSHLKGCEDMWYHYYFEMGEKKNCWFIRHYSNTVHGSPLCQMLRVLHSTAVALPSADSFSSMSSAALL